MLGIDTQTQRQIYGLIELGKLYFLQERNRFLECVRAIFDSRTRLRDILADFSRHASSSPTARSMPLAGRGMCCGASRRGAFISMPCFSCDFHRETCL